MLPTWTVHPETSEKLGGQHGWVAWLADTPLDSRQLAQVGTTDPRSGSEQVDVRLDWTHPLGQM
jgi:hypothetical protein